MTLMNELLPVLQGYLKSSKNLRDCAEWLASVDWDDPELAEHEKKAIGLFELLATDISEGFRDESEFRDTAAKFVATSTDKLFSEDGG
jgi:hypothetical protein